MRATRAPIRNLGIFIIGCLLACLSMLPAQADEPIRVFVSVLPQKHFVEQIGGKQVQVESMVLPGFNPETYEPTAQQVSRLAQADLFIRIGMPYEDAWMKRIQAVNPKMPIMDARDGLTLREMPAHSHDGHDGHGHGHEAHGHEAHGHEAHGHEAHGHEAHGHEAAGTEQTAQPDGHAGHDAELDAHIWTSPRMVKQMLPPLRDKLISLIPDNAADIAANYERTVAELDALDKELTELFSQSPNKKFMVFHPAWGYLADAYHLTQIPIEFEGKEPGAKALATLIVQAQTEGVKTVFVQPQFDQRAARQVAKAIDGKVVSIDPLAEDYLPNLRKTARLIAGADDE